MKEIGIYIHIPFCKSKCYYCDFTSFANKQELVTMYVECLLKEIQNKANDNYKVKTIFIGGGTPSFIDYCYIEKIINKIKKNYNVDQDAEITIEVNPGTANKEKLKKYYELGINRLSIGLQTANNDLLKEIGRIHKYEDYEKTVKIAKEVGFTNINTDLIIGIPNQTIYDVEDTINKLLILDLTHFSVYSLIIEPGTQLESMIEEGKLKLPDEEIERYMYWFAKRKLEENGYIHYEISNFAKPGYSSKHNVDCWTQKEYLGFGVAASSYMNKKRFTNTHCIEEYIKNINLNKYKENVSIEEEQDEKAEMNEYILLGLRKLKGVNLTDFKNKFSKDLLKEYEESIKKLLVEDLITIDYNTIKLSKKGLDLANLVWEEFI